MSAKLAPGTPVSFSHFGAILHGVIARDTGFGIVWVLPEGTTREVWKHRESVATREISK